mmetsp:Transcript_13153/g.19817  ORF Transcript_13153/g.19817 Transcript_13153/m.19817 type:complete len:115 (+) Transcript_13153:187-531(+)
MQSTVLPLQLDFDVTNICDESPRCAESEIQTMVVAPKCTDLVEKRELKLSPRNSDVKTSSPPKRDYRNLIKNKIIKRVTIIHEKVRSSDSRTVEYENEFFDVQQPGYYRHRLRR